jgi:heme exporter protein D
MADFLAMGGYAWFVWPSYALAAAILGGMLATSLRRLRRAERRLAEIEARRPRRSREPAPRASVAR